MQVRRYFDSLLFLDRAEPFLMRAEAENGIMLGLRGRPGSRPPVFGGDCYLATIEEDNDVVACAVRTPPFGVIVTRAERRPIECMVNDLADKYGSLPAVLGPEPTVSVFAECWSARMGTPARVTMRQRLFEIRQVQPLTVRPAGSLRIAGEVDLPMLAAWASAFHDEARLRKPVDPREEMRHQVARQTVFVWDAGGPVSMAGYAGRTARGVRIGFVYTPPEHRGHGYASACVADLTDRLLNEGQAFCCISTDLANPTSNRIYQAIGYRPVCDMSDFDLMPAPSSPSDERAQAHEPE